MNLDAWLLQQIEANGPKSDLRPGDVGRPIAELAAIVSTLEGGRGGTLLGMHVSAEQVASLRPLAVRARALLDAWRARLIELDPTNGPAALHEIVARHGVTLTTMSNRAMDALVAAAPARSKAALEILEKTLRDVDSLTGWWKENDRLVEDDDIVHVDTGRPDLDALRDFAARHEASEGRALPFFYVRLIASWNGIDVRGERTRSDDLHGWGDPHDFGEPVLWPVGAGYDPYVLTESEFDGIGLPIAFGDFPGSGWFVFDGRAGDDEDAPTFWVPTKFAHGAPVPLTASIADFVTLLCECRLSGTAVLRKCRVPGWGG